MEPNSNKFKEEQKAQTERKVEKVVTGQAKTKKKSQGKKIAGALISDDASKIKSYVVEDVLVPSIKNAISDIVTNGIDIILYGEAGRTKKKSGTSTVSYGGFYNSNNQQRRASNAVAPGRRALDYDDILFETRGDAERALEGMAEIIAMYGKVSVGDLYDLAGVTSNNFQANKYGWLNLANARSERTREGYILVLPKALPLD